MGAYKRTAGCRALPHEGPALVVRSVAATDAAFEGRDDRAMALAGASLTPSDRAHVLEQIDYARTRLEARLSPLGTDFEDTDPIEDLRRSLEPYMPTLTAARELERGAWASKDIAVRVAANCQMAKLAPAEICMSLWDTKDGPRDLGRRARLLAWSASRAVAFDLGTRERALQCARSIREGMKRPTSTVALVLTQDDLALRPDPDRDALQASTRRLGAAMAAAGREGTKTVEALGNATLDERVAAWIDVPPSSLFVVPRLSAITDSEGLRKEIEAAAGGPVQWRHAP